MCQSLPARARPLRRRVLPLAVLGLACVLPAHAYRVLFKDGSSLMAADPIEIQGELAILTLESGTRTTVPLAEIDLERTREANRTKATSGAVVIEGRSQRLLELGKDGEPRTLRDLILERRTSGADDEPAAASGEPPPPRVRRTPAGFNDLSSLQRRPLEDDVAGALGDRLRAKGLRRFQLFAGTSADRALVEITTDDTGQVFAALEAASAALVELHEEGGRGLVLELLLRSSQRSPAGMFTLAFDNAALLAKDRMEPGDFYVQYVEF
jgi:hypothetical protein